MGSIFKTERDSNWYPVGDHLTVFPPPGDKTFVPSGESENQEYIKKETQGEPTS